MGGKREGDTKTVTIGYSNSYNIHVYIHNIHISFYIIFTSISRDISHYMHSHSSFSHTRYMYMYMYIHVHTYIYTCSYLLHCVMGTPTQMPIIKQTTINKTNSYARLRPFKYIYTTVEQGYCYDYGVVLNVFKEKLLSRR